MIREMFRRMFRNGQVAVASSSNASVRRGTWGENVAAAHLRRIGWRIVGRNVRPCKSDRRCELDIVAYVPGERQVVFVEVKTHRRHSPYASRLWAIDRRKRSNLLRASATLVRFLGFGRAPGEGIGYPLHYSWASLVAQKLKNLPALQEACV